MHSNKGYIVPIVLVLILLIVAGFLIFSQKPVESPTLNTLPILVATTTPSSSDTSTSTSITSSTTDTHVSDTKDFSFVCSDKTEGTVTFDNANDLVVLNVDQKTQTLKIGISASGARYVNSDETYVFWNKGNSAFIELNGKITHENCELKAL
jgi:membrane-bound inhibitor of C-type lysozyme